MALACTARHCHLSAPKVWVELPTAPLPKILHVSMPPPPRAAFNIENRGCGDAKDGHSSDKSEYRIHGNLPCCRNQSRDPAKAGWGNEITIFSS